MVGPVHCYTAQLGGDLVLFDTGPPTPEARKYLQENIDLKRLKHVLVTHCHIDHYGQGAWLADNCDATLYLPAKDCLKIANHSERIDGMEQMLSGLGFDEKYLSKLRAIFESGALFPPFPTRFEETESALPGHLGIEIIDCPGHSQSDLVFVGNEWAITGDTLLKGVFQSPVLDVDLESGTRFRNYEAYCSTLLKLAKLSSLEILPAHRKTIKSIEETMLYYISKLLSRAIQLHPYRSEENLFVIIEKITGGRMQDVFHMYLKASEILFMKDFLSEPGLLRSSLEEIGLFEEVSALYYSAVVS